MAQVSTQLSPFDAAGNMLNDGTQVGVLGYDGEGRLASSDATSYLYDAAGQRVAKYNSGVLTNAYLYDASGHRVTELDGAFAVLRREAYAGGRHLGTYDAANNFTYAMADWLGTERARANNNGVICQTSASQPFGAEQQVSGNCSPSTSFYTGKERDAEGGLDYFGARYYASGMGRFMSPDWAAKAEPVAARLGEPLKGLQVPLEVVTKVVAVLRQDADSAGSRAAVERPRFEMRLFI